MAIFTNMGNCCGEQIVTNCCGTESQRQCCTQSMKIPFKGTIDVQFGCCCCDSGNNTGNECDGSFIGMELLFPGAKAPTGWLDESIDHGLLLRQDYPKLFAFAEASENILSEEAWSTQKEIQGAVGAFSSGDGVSTFRIPLMKKVYLRCTDVEKGLSVGMYQSDAIRNITGSIEPGALVEKAEGFELGAFAAKRDDGQYAGRNTGTGNDVISFDASRVVPTAEENRPITVVRLPIIRAK